MNRREWRVNEGACQRGPPHPVSSSYAYLTAEALKMFMIRTSLLPPKNLERDPEAPDTPCYHYAQQPSHRHQ